MKKPIIRELKNINVTLSTFNGYADSFEVNSIFSDKDIIIRIKLLKVAFKAS